LECKRALHREPGLDGAANRSPGIRRIEHGGEICQSKTAVPKMGYFAICEDTEGNTFALWEMNERAT
jgi:predicted enzyme related to lactoylglutathione lyase